MNPIEQYKAVTALRRAVKRARSAGLYLVADADAMALRVTTSECAAELEDLRTLPYAIELDGGCGGADGARQKNGATG